ncbi:hypothetical protein CMEL01_05797 [Colletotrichum melonis]|uniref:Uncharacterized protein n=1 Tax=Colletotrichum melonis TaxID=1209925 RepID=A0AAI9XL05_9PEZI|nr:hypothetical protein CSPX01_01293 [Colletotrichum filicis]KAK1454138.1 hypothetical protein CMEL01_05797 [Colletotrichum melonis]
MARQGRCRWIPRCQKRQRLACRDQLGEASAGLLHALTPEGSGRLDEDWRRVVGVL